MIVAAMSPVQTICLIISGYLLSRACLRAGLHEPWLAWMLSRGGGRASAAVAALMLSACLLSAFAPNALTVLVLLPLATRIRDRLAERGMPARRASTLVGLGLIYGANIGGTTSLLGSPANLYLLVNLQIFGVPGREGLHFLSWLVLGVPLSLGLLLAAWCVLWICEPDVMRASLAGLPALESAGAGGATQVRRAVGLWAVGWLLLLLGGLAALRFAPGARWLGCPLALPPGSGTRLSLIDVGGLLLTGWVLLLLMVPRAGGALLNPRDLLRELPWRGVALGALVLGLMLLLAWTDAPRRVGKLLERFLDRGLSGWSTGLLMVLAVILVTEFLNNTTVALFAFPLALSVAGRLGEPALPLMFAVSLATTCAFMTPIATPVNALAVGGVGQVSLWRMARAGLLLNVAAAAWILVWTRWATPVVIGWLS